MPNPIFSLFLGVIYIKFDLVKFLLRWFSFKAGRSFSFHGSKGTRRSKHLFVLLLAHDLFYGGALAPPAGRLNQSVGFGEP